jgi:hypothetical protein
MKKIEEIQKFLENECEFFDGCVGSSLEFSEEPINDVFQSDLRAFYDDEAKSWLPTPKKVTYFELAKIPDWRKQINSELKPFFHLNEYERQSEKYEAELKLLIESRDKQIEKLIHLLSELLNEPEYEVFELDVRLDGYYACYSKDFIFKLDKSFYLLRAQIHD